MLMWITGKNVQDLAVATYLWLMEKDFFFLSGVLMSNNMVWWK